MSEELQSTLSLRGPSKDRVAAAAEYVKSIGPGGALAAQLVPPPAEFKQDDGGYEGPVGWFIENWGCRGFDLKDGMWWEEYDVGTPDEAQWACWNLVSVSGTPRPILKALSKMLPDIEVGYYEMGFDDDLEIVLAKGEIVDEDQIAVPGPSPFDDPAPSGSF